jgi:hypothetical protein
VCRLLDELIVLRVRLKRQVLTPIGNDWLAEIVRASANKQVRGRE